jgi:hypothetical protein
MPFGIKVFAWTTAILVVLLTALALMVIVEQVCPMGTDRLDELAHCWRSLW